MLADYLKEMRLKHWYKALIVFSGPLFAGALFTNLLSVIASFFAFGFIASAVYVLNDLKDVEQDKLHPKKMNRPIASGRIGKRNALVFAGILFLAALIFGWIAGTLVVYVIISYFVLMMVYALYLKQLAIIDAFTIASGFVLRAFAGCFAAGIKITPWFYIVIFCFAVYLSFCKRLTEINLAGTTHKKSLEVYEKLAGIGIAISGSVTLALYSLYVIGRSGILAWSVPVAFLGLLLHLRETMLGKEVHESLMSPEVILTSIVFVAIVLLSIY